MTVPFPGFGPDPDDDYPPSRRFTADNARDDGGWALERQACSWTDYPPHFAGFRPGQLEAVEEILAAFDAGARTVLLDGQTGVGKTFIANAVRARINKSCTYSCHSIALQEQWRDDFRPYPMLMGRSNYPITWPGTPRFITAADCTWNASAPEAGCHWCPDKKVCPYERAKARAIAAPFRCVNHAYLVTEAAHVGRFLSADSPTELLIIDEAEMLEHSILDQVSVTFPHKIRDDLGLGQPKFVTKEESIKEWLAEVVVPALKRDLAMYPKDTADRKVLRAREAVANRLQQTQFVLAHYDQGWVFDRGNLSRDDELWALRPVWASHWGALWVGKRTKRILAMSATLISGAQVAMDLGLPEPAVTVSVSGGFDPALRPIYLAPVCDLRSKGAEGGPKTIPEREVDKLIVGLAGVLARHPRDRILVHCHTYKLARQIYERLDSPRLMMYEPGGRDDALETYLKTEAAVLVAPSLERGVNLPDDLCRVIVWAKVPFPNLGDPVVRRRRYSGGPAGQRWYSVETIRAVVQGCGRAVRHAEDFAECVAPGTRVLTDDLRWVPAEDLLPGDGIFGFDEQKGSRFDPRRWRKGYVEATGVKILPRRQIMLASGKVLIATPNHRWLSKDRDNRNIKWRYTEALVPGYHHLNRYLDTWETLTDWDSGWLAGLFDGEGCLSLGLGRRNPDTTGFGMNQLPGLVLDQAAAIAAKLGFTAPITNLLQAGDTRAVKGLPIRGGLPEHLRFLGSVRPIRLLKKFATSQAGWKMRAVEYDEVVSIEDIGPGPMVTLQSSTETYFTEGYGSHNTYVLDSAFIGIHRKDRRLMPAWFLAAVRTNFNSRALLQDGERYLRIWAAAKANRQRSGLPVPQRRAPITGSRARRPR